MGKLFPAIDAPMREWIAKQALFFVGTAPLAADGHVNVSPKGPIGSLRVLDERTIAYLDIVGSGAETVAHLRENGRIVVMLCAFEGAPRIVRLHGRGSFVLADDPRFGELLARGGFEETAQPEMRRAIVVVDDERISDSCGYGVPLLRFEETRPHAREWGDRKLRAGGPNALREYQREKNATSIDGLPAIELGDDE
jgi:hypothetical protein